MWHGDIIIISLDYTSFCTVCFSILDSELFEGRDSSSSLCVSEGLAQCQAQGMLNKYLMNEHLLPEDEA